MTMRTSESVRKYGQRVKALIQKLTMEITPSVQVEWYVAGVQSLRKAVRRSEKQDKGEGKKEDRKSRRRRKFSDSDSEEERSPSPPRRSHRSKGAREKAIVKVKTEDPE
jgi:hypothetical protein